jgi:hypothetical protein
VVVVTEVVFAKVVVPEVVLATDTKFNTFQMAKFETFPTKTSKNVRSKRP